MEGWVKIYTAGHEPRIQLLRHLLEKNEIAAFVINKQDRNYLIGDIELYVRPQDVVAAKYLLKDYT